MSALSEVQNEALKRAYQILGEHFDHSLIAVSTLSDRMTEDGNSGDAIRVYWSGGYIAALGLTQIANRVVVGSGPSPTVEPK